MYNRYLEWYQPLESNDIRLMHVHFFIALTLEVHVAAVLLPFQVHSTIAMVGNRTSAIAPDASAKNRKLLPVLP